MKRTRFAAVLAVALLCILITGALAAAMNIWGIRDFWSDLAGEYETALPEHFEEYLQTEDITIEKEYAVYTVPESYFDGTHVCIAVNVRPRDSVFLVDSLSIANDSLYDTGPRNIEVPEEITAAKYALAHCGGKAAEVSLSIEPADGLSDSGGGADTYTLNEDGTSTFFIDMELDNEGQQERKILLHIHYTPAVVAGSGEERRFDPREEDVTTIPLTIHTVEKQQYICHEELLFPEAGIKITKAVLTVTPLEIHYQFDCVVTDPDLCSEFLAFEFVDPETARTDAGQKALPVGVMAFSSSSGSVTDRILHFSGSVCRDAFSDRYAVRAYDQYTLRRFDTVVFSVVPR